MLLGSSFGDALVLVAVWQGARGKGRDKAARCSGPVNVVAARGHLEAGV